MSRKPALQKRQITSRNSGRSLNQGSGRSRLFGRGGFSQSGPRRPYSDQVQLRAPLMKVAISLGLFLLLAGGWLGWQTGNMRTELSQAREEQVGLARDNHALLARREKLLAREQIITRAASLGLYPPRPEQIRKLGSK